MIWSAIFPPPGSQEGVKIEHVDIKSRKNVKRRVPEAFQNKHELVIEIYGKCEARRMLNNGVSSILLQNYSVGAFFVIFGKIEKRVEHGCWNDTRHQ